MNFSANVGKPKHLRVIELKGPNIWTSRQQSFELVKTLTDISRFNQLQFTKQLGRTPTDQKTKDFLNAWRKYFNIRTHDVLCFFYRKKAPIPTLVNGKLFETANLSQISQKFLNTYPVLGDIVHLLTEKFQKELNDYLDGKDKITIFTKSLRENQSIVYCAVVRYFYDRKLSIEGSMIDKILCMLTNTEIEIIQNMAQDDLDRILQIIRKPQLECAIVQAIEGKVDQI